jgi:serine/threonine protein kinase
MSSMSTQKDTQYEEIFKEYKYSRDIEDYGKDLGKGSFGVVKDVKYKNKIFAGKLVMKDTSEEDRLTSELRGPNIIRIHKICKPKVKHGVTFHLIIMEKAILRDLGKLNNYFHDHNLLKLKYEYPFDEQLEDTLLRYYARQIIDGLEILDRNDFVHFDIKPDNILITANLVLKLSDFSILKKLDMNVEEFKIPGGTPGYITPEYYETQRASPKFIKTQDYFGLGSTLFYLKFGNQFLKYKKYEDKKLIADRVIDIIIRNINFIEKQKLIDRDLIYFFRRLIGVKPNGRFNFEEMYRNKWLNKNLDYLDNVVSNFETDEEKLLLELQKQDFFMQKKEIFEFNHPEIKVTSNKNKERYKRKCFKFKKMEKYIEKINNIESNN